MEIDANEPSPCTQERGELEKTEEEVVIPDAPRKVRIFPSEIGSWEYCNIKWLYEKSQNKRET